MMRRTISLLLFALLIMLSLPLPVQAAKSYTADRYNVTIAIQPGGNLRVTETVVFRFEGGPFRFVFRDLEYRQIDSIENVRAYLDGALLPEGSGPSQVEIERGRPLKVTWHFPPTSDTTHEFRLEYIVLGAVRFSDTANTIFWRAVPEEHEYTIDNSRIIVEYPSDLSPLSTPSLNEMDVPAETDAGRAVFTIHGIEEDTSVDVQISFPAGSLITQPPAWQALEAQRRRDIRAAIPYAFGSAALVFAIGAAGLISFYNRNRSEHSVPLSFSSQQQTPPIDLPPALAAKLTGSSNSAIATIFDLARRGVLQIEMSRGMFGSKQFSLLRLPTNEALRPHERGLLEILFEDKRGWRDRITFSELGTRLGSKQKEFNTLLDEEAASYGWIDLERKAKRSRMMTTAMLIFLAGIVVFILGLLPFGILPQAVMIGAGIALFIIGIIALIIGASYSPLSPTGIQQAEAWKSFSTYLKNVTRGREAAVRPDSFDLYLPFAAGFGLAAAWARFFERQQNVPVPEWLSSLQSAGGSFSDVTAAIIASQGASSSAASGGAAGASGGGASGAG